jgi:hypothetical protein
VFAAEESAQLLKRHEITPDTAGISTYLRGSQPSKGEQQRIAALIVRLDGKDFADREAASRELVRLGKRTRAALQQAAKIGSIEVKQRASSILALKDNRTERLMLAVFVTIEKRRPTGLTELLLKTVPLCDREHLRLSLVRTLSASARQSDEETLTAILKSGTQEQQGAAVLALESVLGEKSIRNADADDPVNAYIIVTFVRSPPDATDIAECYVAGPERGTHDAPTLSLASNGNVRWTPCVGDVQGLPVSLGGFLEDLHVKRLLGNQLL